MDNSHGRFVEPPSEIVEKAQRQVVPGVFHLGQEVEVNGSRFRVVSIKPKKMTLKLLPNIAEPQP